MCVVTTRRNLVTTLSPSNFHKPGTAKILLINPKGCTSIGKHVFLVNFYDASRLVSHNFCSLAIFWTVVCPRGSLVAQADHPLFMSCVYCWNLSLDFEATQSVEILCYYYRYLRADVCKYRPRVGNIKILKKSQKNSVDFPRYSINENINFSFIG